MTSRLARAFVAVVTLALVAVVVLIGPRFFGGGTGHHKAGPQLTTAAIRSFPVTVGASGTVVPASEISLDFNTPGRLIELDAQVGAKVTKGTVLARLDDATAQSDASQAQAALAAAQASLNAARAPLDPTTATRLQAEVTSASQTAAQIASSVQFTNAADASAVAGDQQQLAADLQQYADAGCSSGAPPDAAACQVAVSGVNADRSRLQTDQARAASDAAAGQSRSAQAQTQLAQARSALQAASIPVASQVASAQAALASAQARVQATQTVLANLSLTAPRDGTILQVNGQVGENVTGSPNSAPSLPGTTAPIPAPTGVQTTAASGQALIVLGDPTTFVVGAAFPANVVQMLSAHQQGTVTASVLSGLSIPGHILAVAQAPSLVNSQPEFYVTVVPDGLSTKLVSGMAVNVSIAISHASNVLAVPQSAVYTLAGIPHVDVWTGKRSVPTVVQTGLQGTELVQITSGLTAGQQVVLSAFQGLPEVSPSATTIP